MKDIDESTTGGRIRKVRIERKLTTRELAEQVGVSQNYLSVVERNDKKQASIALLQKIAKATGASLAWLKDGESITTKAAHFNDAQLLLTLILQQKPSITKETVAVVLDVDVETVDGILSGTVEYDPRWKSGLSNLAQRLDLATTRQRLQKLDAFLQQEDEKRSGIRLFEAFRDYFSKEYKTSYKFAGPPVRVSGELEYTQFVLQRKNSSETWNIRFYPATLDNDDASAISEEVGASSENCNVAIALADADSYDKMLTHYENIRNRFELSADLDASRGLPVSEYIGIDVYLILVDCELGNISRVEHLYDLCESG